MPQGHLPLFPAGVTYLTHPRAPSDHRPALPTRACCKTGLKFLSFILRRSLLKRVGGLAVDSQHLVHLRRRRYGTI